MSNPFQKNSDQQSKLLFYSDKNLYGNTPNNNSSNPNSFKQGNNTSINTNPFGKGPVNQQQSTNSNPQQSSNGQTNNSKGNILNQKQPNSLFGKN